MSFDGSGSGNNAKVELVRYTATGTGTVYSPLRGNGEAQNKASLLTAKVNDTVEPTGPTVVRTWYVPLSGLLPYLLPLGRELYVPVSSWFGVRITSPVVVNAAVNIEFEE